MTKSRAFIMSVLCFAVGVFMGSVVDVPFVWTYVGLGLIVVLFVVAYAERSKGKALAALFLFACGLGLLRTEFALTKPNEYVEQYGLKEDFDGMIVADPDVRTDKQLLTILPDGMASYVLATTTLAQDFQYGDRVWVRGKLDEPKPFDDFDYKAYLERHSVYALMRYPRVIILRHGEGSGIVSVILAVKQYALERFAAIIPRPESDLLFGLLLGHKGTLPADIVESFKRTGTSHIIAVSGFNISIIIGALGFLVFIMRRWLSVVVVTSLITAFVIMVGPSSSVIRAAIMGVLFLLSFIIGRVYSPVSAITFAALVMLVQNPRVLYWDIGFQLSFAATLGIVAFIPELESMTERIPNPKKIKTGLLTTFAATLATWPLISLQFGTLSLVTLVTNMLVLPAVPAAMLFGFLTVLPIVGPGAGFVATYLLRYMIVVIDWFARFTYASIDVQLTVFWFVIWSVATVMLYMVLRRWNKNRGKAGPPLA